MKKLKDQLFEKTRFVKPYGDSFNDGIVQLSFTLPATDKYVAIESAKVLVSKMGIKDVKIATVEEPIENFYFFVVYGSVIHEVDLEQVKPIIPEYEKMSKEEVERYAKEHGIEKIVIVGATIGTDSHTVGLDSILNVKGFKGEKGLEACKCFKVYKLPILSLL